MNSLIFSQTAIFRLHQLGSQYYHHTGERHRLANEGGILDLLQSSASIADRKVRGAYYAFVAELNKRQIDALAERGIRLRIPATLH
ncbi:MAG: hypothetical protein EOO53_08880 [Gammaproteobacteria bacterium]|nr:MAG: hypothetical protein EOO53_08880 [Gammaproteobacteria bacterium]